MGENIKDENGKVIGYKGGGCKVSFGAKRIAQEPVAEAVEPVAEKPAKAKKPAKG